MLCLDGRLVIVSRSCFRTLFDGLMSKIHALHRTSKYRDQEITMSFTYKPSRIRRARRHGFRARMATRAGRAVLNRRRAKGRKQLSV